MLFLFIEENAAIMNDKEKPCQQEIVKRAAALWNRLDSPSKDGRFRKIEIKILEPDRPFK
jgi:hypothetical protein